MLDMAATTDAPAIIPADVATSVSPSGVARARRLVSKIYFGACDAVRWMLGLASLLVGLAILAPTPVLQFFSLGYLLEAGGRVARTGRLRDGFIGVDEAWRIGRLVIGAWLVLLPLRFVSSLAADAELIAPGSDSARAWRYALNVLTVLAVLHIVGAVASGGKLRHFLVPRPIRAVRSIARRGAYAEACDSVWGFIVRMRAPYFFWMGVRGYFGALAWLFIPVSLIAAGQRAPALAFIGGLLLTVVVLYLPFLQARFAAENRFRAMFEVGAVRRLFKKAPILFALALALMLSAALPLYLLKIELVPREAAWLPSLVFVVFILPSRLAVGWAVNYGLRRERPRPMVLRWTGRLLIIPVAIFYSLIVYFTQFTSWHGVVSLYEQHAFLLPAAFSS